MVSLSNVSDGIGEMGRIGGVGWMEGVDMIIPSPTVVVHLSQENARRRNAQVRSAVRRSAG